MEKKERQICFLSVFWFLVFGRIPVLFGNSFQCHVPWHVGDSTGCCCLWWILRHVTFYVFVPHPESGSGQSHSSSTIKCGPDFVSFFSLVDN